MTWYSKKESLYLGAVGGTIGICLMAGSAITYVQMMNTTGQVTNLPSILLTSGTAITAAGLLIMVPYLYHKSEEEYDKVHNNPLFFIYGIGLVNGPLIAFAISYYLSTNLASHTPLGTLDPLLVRLGYGALISVILGGGLYAALAYKLLSKREQESGYTEKRRWYVTLAAACLIGGVGSTLSTVSIILIEHYMLIEPSLATWINLGLSFSIGLITVPLLSVALTPLMKNMEPKEVEVEEEEEHTPDEPELSQTGESGRLSVDTGTQAEPPSTPRLRGHKPTHRVAGTDSERMPRKFRSGSVFGITSNNQNEVETMPLARKLYPTMKQEKTISAPSDLSKRTKRSLSFSHQSLRAAKKGEPQPLNREDLFSNEQNADTTTVVQNIGDDRKAQRLEQKKSKPSPRTERRNKIEQEKGSVLPTARVKIQEGILEQPNDRFPKPKRNPSGGSPSHSPKALRISTRTTGAPRDSRKAPKSPEDAHQSSLLHSAEELLSTQRNMDSASASTTIAPSSTPSSTTSTLPQYAQISLSSLSTTEESERLNAHQTVTAPGIQRSPSTLRLTGIRRKRNPPAKYSYNPGGSMSAEPSPVSSPSHSREPSPERHVAATSNDAPATFRIIQSEYSESDDSRTQGSSRSNSNSSEESSSADNSPSRLDYMPPVEDSRPTSNANITIAAGVQTALRRQSKDWTSKRALLNSSTNNTSGQEGQPPPPM